MEQLFYLVLTISSTIVMPDKYTNDQCQKALAKYKNSSIGALCVPAPKCMMLTFENINSVKCAY